MLDDVTILIHGGRITRISASPGTPIPPGFESAGSHGARGHTRLHGYALPRDHRGEALPPRFRRDARQHLRSGARRTAVTRRALPRHHDDPGSRSLTPRAGDRAPRGGGLGPGHRSPHLHRRPDHLQPAPGRRRDPRRGPRAGGGWGGLYQALRRNRPPGAACRGRQVAPPPGPCHRASPAAERRGSAGDRARCGDHRGGQARRPCGARARSAGDIANTRKLLYVVLGGAIHRPDELLADR